MSIIEAKVRRIGSSLGVLFPIEIIRENNIKEGERISLVIPLKKKVKLIEKAFGMARGAKPFVRNNIDRKL